MVYCFTSFHLIGPLSVRALLPTGTLASQGNFPVLPQNSSRDPWPAPSWPGNGHHLTVAPDLTLKDLEDEPQEGRLGFKAGLRAFLASVQETEVLLVCGPQLMRPWRQKVNLEVSLLSGCLGFLRLSVHALGKTPSCSEPSFIYWGSTLPWPPCLLWGWRPGILCCLSKLSFPTEGSFLPAHLSLSSSQSLVSLCVIPPGRLSLSVPGPFQSIHPVQAPA